VRTLLKAVIPTEKGNPAIVSGKIEQLIKQTAERLHPEAMYFLPQDGKRAMLVVFDLADPSQIPVVAEPFFLELNAEIELTPVMNLDDVSKGIAAVQEAVKQPA
jgi:hypothetical protein